MTIIRNVLFLLIAIYSFASFPSEKITVIRKSPEYKEALAKGALARINLRVYDDGGQPVSNAHVKAVFDMTTHARVVEGVTDAGGFCNLESKTRGNSIVIHVRKRGYYDSERKICLIGFEHAHAVKKGLWQPAPMQEAIPIRRIKNPDQNLVQVNRIFDLPGTNVWYGFDMAKADFVAPYGKGLVTDIECRAEWDGLPAWKSKRCYGSMRFAGNFCGGTYVANIDESTFPYPYVASVVEPILTHIDVIDRDGDPHMTKVSFPANSSLTTRVRCIWDKNRNLKSANYGSIRNFSVGPSRRGVVLLVLNYVFNPEPNDRNLEVE